MTKQLHRQIRNKYTDRQTPPPESAGEEHEMHSKLSTARPNHILFKISSKSPAPAGHGDAKSWFLFYKWGVEGELYVPTSSPYSRAKPGDVIWFSVDGKLLGHAIIHRVEEDPINQRQELWYHGHTVRPHPKKKKLKGAWGRYVSRKQAKRWLKECYNAGAVEESSVEDDSDGEKESLIQRAPSAAEIKALNMMKVAPERLGLMPVTYKGEERVALVTVVNEGESLTGIVLALLLQPGDQLFDVNGNELAPRPEFQGVQKSSLN